MKGLWQDVVSNLPDEHFDGKSVTSLLTQRVGIKAHFDGLEK